jgi:hypothetical protein
MGKWGYEGMRHGLGTLLPPDAVVIPSEVEGSALRTGGCRSLDSLRSLGMTALATLARDDSTRYARSG